VRLGDLGRTLANLPSMIAVLFTATFLGAIYTLFTYFTPLMEAKMGFGRNMISLSLVVFGVGAVLGNWLGGRLTVWLGPVRTLLLLACAQVLLMAAFSLMPLPLPVFFVLVLVWSVFGWSFMAPQQTRLVGLSPQTAPVLLSLNAAAVYIGAALGSAAGGVIIARFGIEALGLASGGAALLAIAHIVLSRRLSG
jgi:predicted MFS family arabinose efflux permease